MTEHDHDTGRAVLVSWAMVAAIVGLAFVFWLLATGD